MADLVEQEQEEGLGQELKVFSERVLGRPSDGRRNRRGAGRFGPLLLVLPLAFALGFGLRALRSRAHSALPGKSLSALEMARVPDVHAKAELAGYGGALILADGQVELRLAPLEAVPEVQQFIANSWAQRLGLDDGEPWRLELNLEPGSQAFSPLDLRIEDDQGLALCTPALSSATKDPLAVLLRARDQPLSPGQPYELILWGRPPQGAVRMVVGSQVADLKALQFASGELPRWLAAPNVSPPDEGASAGRAASRAAGHPAGHAVGHDEPGAASTPSSDPSEIRRDEQNSTTALLEQRISELEAQLADLRTRRAERELAWHEYNRALGDLDIDSVVAAFGVNEDLLLENGLVDRVDAGAESREETGEPSQEGLEAQRKTEREREIERGVRSLLTLEGFSGLDLLELGPTRGAVGAGPAIFRMLDDRGRLLGSLNAKLLRLEASRAARTITLVLEDGYESRGGHQTPFTGGSRRLLIPYVDPQPWIDELPELFGPTALNQEIDDGHWELEALRQEMNRLLALETSGGWWRLQGVGGVLGNTLRDVQLEQLGPDGGTRRRIFADRLRILTEDPGLLLILEDGAILRGTHKTPFVDGSYRLFLPAAPLEEWCAAKIPRSGA